MVNRANGHRANDHRTNGNRADVVAPIKMFRCFLTDKTAKSKELSLCQILIFSNPYIISTQCRIPLICQT